MFCIIFVGHAIGRDAFLEHGIIPPVAKLFDDKEDIARKNAHMAIEMISETPSGKYINQHMRFCYIQYSLFITLCLGSIGMNLNIYNK